MTWTVPLRLGPDGEFHPERKDFLADTARLVLAIAPGERPFLPGFGWKAHRLGGLEGPAARHAAEVLAEDALREWAPDLGVERVVVVGVRGRTVELSLRRGDREARIEIELRGEAP